MTDFNDAEGLIRARLGARELAQRAGLGLNDQTRFVAAVSELGRNAIRYAGGATCHLRDASDARRIKVEAEVVDHGPGIADIELAMHDGYSSGDGLGVGLPGVKRITDLFDVTTSSSGTRIKVQVSRNRRA